MGALSYLRDGLINALSGRGTSVDRAAYSQWVNLTLTPQQIEAAYRSSWLTRQIVDIPAQDMTRAGRDWDAEKDEIEKIENEEKRLGYWAKVRQALIYGRLGGGALFLNLMDRNPAAPLPATISLGMLESIVPLHRTQISIGQMDDDLLSPSYGDPLEFRVNTPARPLIHPSRLIVFKGQSVPDIGSASWEDRYWGDSIVQTVNEAVQNAATATGGFAALIDEAKVDVFRINGLAEALMQVDGEAKIAKRVQATSIGKSNWRAVYLDKEDEWDHRQVNWAGMPDVMAAYRAEVSGAADIPATRLFGKSPDGMNATGASDLVNYFQSVSARQHSDLRPSLERLDAVVLPGVGLSPDLSWNFSPLMVMSEKEQAEIEKIEAETVTAYVNSGLFPESAMAKTVQNRLLESQRWPGLEDAIAEAGDEPAGNPDELGVVPINSSEGGDPYLAGKGGSGSRPARRAANDKKADAPEGQ